MANIIEVGDFVVELVIANISQPEVSNPLKAFIVKYEPKFLQQLFGMDFYNVFVDHQSDERFVLLIALPEFKQAIAGYVYYWFSRNNVTRVSDNGDAKIEAANSTRSQAGYKQEKAFNDMVSCVYVIAKYLFDHPVTYPEYVAPQWLAWRFQQGQWWNETRYSYPYTWKNIPEIFTSINSLNL